MQQLVVAWYVTNNGGKKFVLQNAFVQYQVIENIVPLNTFLYDFFFLGGEGGCLGKLPLHNLQANVPQVSTIDPKF